MTKLRTIAGVEKYSKIPGAGCGKHAEWLPKDKIKAFKVLFDSIKSKIGNNAGAIKYIGLSKNILDNFREGKISTRTGRKILDAYNRIKQ